MGKALLCHLTHASTHAHPLTHPFAHASSRSLTDASLDVVSTHAVLCMHLVLLTSAWCVCRGGIRAMMITGDYHHTAIAVARAVGMVKPQAQMVVIDTICQPELHSELSAMRSPHDASAMASPTLSPRVSFFDHGSTDDADHRDDPDHPADLELICRHDQAEHRPSAEVLPQEFPCLSQFHMPTAATQGGGEPEDIQQQLFAVGDGPKMRQLPVESPGVAECQQQRVLAPLCDAARMQSELASRLKLPNVQAVSQDQQQCVLHPQSVAGLKPETLGQLEIPQQTAESPELRHGTSRRLPPLMDTVRMKSKLEGQFDIPESAAADHDQLQDKLLMDGPLDSARAFLTSTALAQDDDYLPALTGRASAKSKRVSMLSVPASGAVSQLQDEDEEERNRAAGLSGIARVKSRLMSLLHFPAEGTDIQDENQPAGSSEPPELFSSRAQRTFLSICIPPAAPEPSWEGLRFLTAGHEIQEAAQVLTALAEGRMQCAVTGDAFEHLLQHHDLSVLETVMRNGVIFSRMRPHQKGQVMDLLSIRGIHQQFNGRPRHIPVCSLCILCD